jgi:hypothetical protein
MWTVNGNPASDSLANMNLPSNPTAGRGTPVWAPLYHSANGKRLMQPGWLLDFNDATKRARVWVAAKLISFPVGELEDRKLTS